MSHFINPSNVNPFDANMTGPDRRSGAMMSKVGNPQIYEDHEQRYVSPIIHFKHPTMTPPTQATHGQTDRPQPAQETRP